MLLALPAPLIGCAHHQPVWSQGTVIRIAGKASQDLSPKDVFPQMLALAARATVNHGYRYFVLVNASQSVPRLAPGADLDVRVLSGNESGRGVLDAYRLLEAPGSTL